MVKNRVWLWGTLCLVAGLATTASAWASQMRCTGDLSIIDQKGKSHKLNQPLILSKDDSFKFTVVDQNSREIVKIWPWGTVQTKVLIPAAESKQRNYEFHTNDVSWVSVDIDSTSSKARGSLRCEMEE